MGDQYEFSIFIGYDISIKGYLRENLWLENFKGLGSL